MKKTMKVGGCTDVPFPKREYSKYPTVRFLTVEKFTEQEEEGKSYFDGGNRTVWDTVPFYKWEKVQAA